MVFHTCPICLDVSDASNMFFLTCTHCVHEECAFKQAEYATKSFSPITCPLCRTPQPTTIFIAIVNKQILLRKKELKLLNTQIKQLHKQMFIQKIRSLFKKHAQSHFDLLKNLSDLEYKHNKAHNYYITLLVVESKLRYI